MNNLLRIGFVFLCMSVAEVVQATQDLHWYKNEMLCEGVKITVRSFCEDEPNLDVNTFCTAQSMSLEKNSEKIEIKNILKHEPVGGNYHSLWTIGCVVAPDNTPYLILGLANGGNCIGCELDAIIGLDGKWKQYGKKWFVTGTEKLRISKNKKNWITKENFLLKNKIPD